MATRQVFKLSTIERMKRILSKDFPPYIRLCLYFHQQIKVAVDQNTNSGRKFTNKIYHFWLEEISSFIDKETKTMSKKNDPEYLIVSLCF